MLGAPYRRVMLATDVSLTGWGVVMNGHPTLSLWSGHHSAWHISCLEMLAVFQSSSGSSNNTRGQSRETGSLSRLFGSVKTTPKCICLGPAHCRARLSHLIRRSAAAFQRGLSHSGGPRAGSGNEAGSRHSLKKGGHRGGPSSRQGVRVLQAVLHCSEEGWGEVAFRSKNTYLHMSILQHRKFLRFALGVRRTSSGSSVQPCTLTPHFHQVCGYCSGSSETPGHTHTELYQQLLTLAHSEHMAVRH
ncbi:hypothetical protein M9458_050784 [Cirrhinus mrigala]|uniref:Uncharacterized protein n=1 Tax=Cirrhinus mrigala TaxID=683832 RepID=A0ABD0MY53_CIRMR